MSDKKKLFVAGFWVILIFGLGQLVRLGSNLIVTRMLEPEMFGVMAIVYVVTAGIAMFSDLGLWAFIVRHKDPSNPHMLSAVWTLQVIRGWLMYLGLVMLVLVLVIGNLYMPQSFDGVYSDSRLPLLILIAGLSSVIGSYKSMASPVLSRQMQMGKLEATDFIAQIVGVAVMLVWVWIYPSIWALASAGLAATLAGTLLSYLIFPYRHKFIWDKAVVKEVFHFGKWIVISSILTYFFMQGDRLFLAGAISATELGVYSIAFMLAGVLTSITHSVAGKIAFPALSSTVHNNRQSLKHRYYKIRTYLDSSTFLVAGVLIALAPTIVGVLYDVRYVNAGWMLQILIFSVVSNSLSAISLECLSALSITKVNMWVMLARTIGLLIGLPIFYHLYGLKGAIWVVALNPMSALPVVYWTLSKHSVFSFYKEIRMLPVVGLGYLLAKSVLYFSWLR